MRKKIIISFLIPFLFGCSTGISDCSFEKETYQDNWNETVLEIGRNTDYKATYYVKVKDRQINIRMCELIMYGQKGDSIVKPKNSFLVDVYRNGKIEFTSRVISATCDTIVDKNYKFKTYEELKEEHPHLYNWR